jgi:hypothetical protein
MGTAVERRLAASACLNLEHAEEETVRSVVGTVTFRDGLEANLPPFLSYFPTLMLVEVSGIAWAHDSPTSSVWPMASGRLPITGQLCPITNVRGRLIFFNLIT